MRQTVSLKHLIILLLVFLCATVGCKRGDTDIITAFPENGPTVTAAINKAQQMLDQDEDIDVILTTLEDQLKADPRVYDTEVESEIGSVSFVFNNGETHTIALRDPEFDSEVVLPYLEDLAYDFQSTSVVTDSAEEPPLQQQVPMGGVYRLPANNQALLANGYVFFHGKNGDNKDKKVVLTDSTEIIKGMLKARGYEVERPTETVDKNGNSIIQPVIPVELFKTLTNYSVILIETHGGRRNLKAPLEDASKSFPNCGGAFGKYKLVTTEIATKDSYKKYMADIICGRVAFHEKLFKTAKGKLVQVYDITPNFILQYNKGNFPDNTLMVLDVCSADKSDTGSPSAMKALLFQKSNKGGRFLGWNGNAEVALMGGVSLNLFQLMTASNEKLTVKNITFLKKSTPPQGGRFTPLTKALDELKKKSYLTDPTTGAKLNLTSQNDDGSDLILMPHPLGVFGSMDWYPGYNNWAQLFMYSDTQPTVTIGGTAVTVTPTAGTDTWALSSVPVGAYGDIVVSENGRTSIPRPLHRWRPQIKVTSVSSPDAYPFMKYDITFTLQARSTLEFANSYTGEVQDCFRDSVDNAPPPAQFAAYLDLSASNVAWTISGEGTEDETSYKYQGSGLNTFTEGGYGGVPNAGSVGGVLLYTDSSGTSVHLSLWAGNHLTFTQSVYDNPTGETNTYDLLLPFHLEQDNIAIADDWGVFPDSFQADVAGGGMAQISWNQFPAEPPFDKDNELR